MRLPRDLGHGLILRAGTPADSEALATFNADVIRGQDMQEPQASLGEWTRDLMEGRHPVATAADATIVEDTADGAIVSATIHLSHSWSYGGVRIPVGQPELVGTRVEYRGRGLVRTILDHVHARSAARGEVMQAITGIPWFYRQFGYEMAIERGGGGILFASELRALAPGGTMRVRPATEADVTFLGELDREASTRRAMWVPRDAAEWRYELSGHRSASAAHQVICIIEDAGAHAIGMLAHSPSLWHGTLGVHAIEVAQGVSWRHALVAALHHLRATGEALGAASGSPFDGASFWVLGREHPLYTVLRVRYRAADTWYAIYTRVPDVPAFLQAVAPALERRLAASALAGHSAELRLSFYRDGVRIELDRGRVKTVERWTPRRTLVGQEMGLATSDPHRAHALFPDLTFLQLLFGLRSADELEAWFPDCILRTAEARGLLNALFPRAPSYVWPVL